MADTPAIPLRSEIPEKDRWNLSRLFADEKAWEAAYKEYQAMLPEIGAYKSTLGLSAEALHRALVFYRDFGVLDERLGVYASLRQSEDEGLAASRGRFARYMMGATEAQGAWSWMVPEIQALSAPFVEVCLAEERFAEFDVFLRKLLRFKPHVLGEKEERLLALQAETAQTPHEAFSVLTNVDLDFGEVDTPEGSRPLTQSTFSSFMRSPDRELRRRAYMQFYRAYDGHKNTIAALYAGSVKQDAYRAKVRNYAGARSAALFPDDVSEAVYDNLVAAVGLHASGPARVLRAGDGALKLDELRHYDVYVPVVSETKSRHSYAEAVELVSPRLFPLGEDYVKTIRAGFEGGWVDRYENKGKALGRLLLGLLHGRALHPDQLQGRPAPRCLHPGARGRATRCIPGTRRARNPFLCTALHDLRGRGREHLQRAAALPLPLRAGRRRRDARLSRQHGKLDDHRRHALPPDDVRRVRGQGPRDGRIRRAAHRRFAARRNTASSLEKYFGPAMQLEAVSDLEGLRIPHFYSAFYVYKYATGISASIALAERVLGGRRPRARGLLRLPALRRVALSHRVAEDRWRRHVEPRARQGGLRRVRATTRPSSSAY